MEPSDVDRYAVPLFSLALKTNWEKAPAVTITRLRV